MKFWQQLRNLLIGSLKAMGILGAWLALFIALRQPILWLNTEHYAPSDTPNPHFRVLIISEQGEYPTQWQDAQQANWVRDGVTHCHTEDCLIAQPDGSLKYHNEGALWFSESRYRIIDNKIVPISFVFYTIIDMMMQMIGATILYKIGKYGLMRWRLHGAPDELKLYHQVILFKLKIWAASVAVLVALYVLLENS